MSIQNSDCWFLLDQTEKSGIKDSKDMISFKAFDPQIQPAFQKVCTFFLVVFLLPIVEVFLEGRQTHKAV